ncbi:hypothetical protein RLJV_23680 [Pseudomonas aeruginosa]|nr:hypothetical protein RLJV_23680 [Pseudomonas aeruginosa]
MLLQRQVGGQLRQQVGCVIERAHVAVFDPQQAVLEILPGSPLLPERRFRLFSPGNRRKYPVFGA